MVERRAAEVVVVASVRAAAVRAAEAVAVASAPAAEVVVVRRAAEVVVVSVRAAAVRAAEAVAAARNLVAAAVAAARSQAAAVLRAVGSFRTKQLKGWAPPASRSLPVVRDHISTRALNFNHSDWPKNRRNASSVNDSIRSASRPNCA